MTEPAVETPTPPVSLAAPPDGPPPTRAQLEALNKDELNEQFGVSKNQSKADMVDAVLTAHGVPTPKANEVVLAVGVPVSEHYWSADSDPITPTGTPVPASKVEDIIREAALGGVTVYEVN